MKKSILFFLFGIILTLRTFSSTSPFQIERLSTDYNGVIEINGRIIVYGNNGIITYSEDNGKNWKQINLGEYNHILKIIKDEDGNLYALTSKNILASKDGGKSWTEKNIMEEQNMLDFALGNDVIYFITTNYIGEVDKNFRKEPQIMLQFDDFTSFSKCLLLGKYLFVIEGKYFIYRVDITTKEIDTINIHTKISSYYRDIENIKVKDSVLFVLVAFGINSPVESEYTNKRHLIIKSTDFGSNWGVVTNNLPVSLDFLIEEEGVATLAPICFYLGYKNPFFGLSFVRINKGEFTEYIQGDTNNIWLPYYPWVNKLNKYIINSIEKINDNLLIAVGTDKIILLSSDDGRTWELKSFFRPIFSDIFGELEYNVQVLGKDTIIVVTNTKPFCFYSIDRGATFLPILRNQTIHLEENLFIRVPILFPSGTFGFLGFKNDVRANKEKDTLIIMYSEDLGKTFVKLEHPFGYISNNDSITIIDSIKIILIHSGCFLKETNEFLVSIFIPLQSDGNSKTKFLLYRMNDKFNFVDTIFLNFYLFGLVSYSEGLIISDGTFFYKSKDYGKTLIPLSNFPRASYERNQKDYLRNKLLGTIQNQLLIFESTPISARLLKFDMETNSFDSLTLSEYETSTSFINLKDTVIVSTNKNIYIFPNIKEKFHDFKIIPIDSIVSDGALIGNSITNEASEVILILEQINKSEIDFLISLTPINLARINSNPSFPLIKPELEESFIYLYAFPPFPNPAEDWVETQVFWDCMQGNYDLKISLFDTYGRKFNLPIEIIPAGNCSNIVKFCTTFLPIGVYYMTFNVGTRNITYPLVVFR